jgi:hypothetical protein
MAGPLLDVSDVSAKMQPSWMPREHRWDVEAEATCSYKGVRRLRAWSNIHWRFGRPRLGFALDQSMAGTNLPIALGSVFQVKPLFGGTIVGLARAHLRRTPKARTWIDSTETPSG